MNPFLSIGQVNKINASVKKEADSYAWASYCLICCKGACCETRVPPAMLCLFVTKPFVFAFVSCQKCSFNKQFTSNL